MCGCTPRIAVRPACTYYGERWVAIGDAVVSRLYKDGINSAYLTAETAMRTAVERGIGYDDFTHGYAPFCRQLAGDNTYGELLYGLCWYGMRFSPLARASMACVRREAGLEASRRLLSRLMWGLLTGDESYRKLFWLAFRPRSLARLGTAMVKELLGSME